MQNADLEFTDQNLKKWINSGLAHANVLKFGMFPISETQFSQLLDQKYLIAGK